jgi:hypothetical protein
MILPTISIKVIRKIIVNIIFIEKQNKNWIEICSHKHLFVFLMYKIVGIKTNLPKLLYFKIEWDWNEHTSKMIDIFSFKVLAIKLIFNIVWTIYVQVWIKYTNPYYYCLFTKADNILIINYPKEMI